MAPVFIHAFEYLRIKPMPIADWVVAPVMTDHLQKKAPDRLYHYTNQAGLLGIMRTRSLWATDIQFLNDHGEFWYGTNLAHDAISHRLESVAVDDERRHLESMKGRLSMTTKLFAVYVASLSELDDDLAQWRAYSGTSTGYAVCVFGDTIRTLADKQHFTFAACIYDVAEQERWMDKIIDTSLREMIDDEKAGITYYHSELSDKFVSRVFAYGPLFKHPSFAGEHEWRLISTRSIWQGNPSFDIREGRSTLVPYRTFRLEDEGAMSFHIPEIVVGPCAFPALAEKAAMDVLVKYVMALGPRIPPPQGGTEYSARSSAIPYRNW
jgi:hypothetical protein